MKIRPEQIQIKDFDYSLPSSRIAAFPLAERSASRLLVYRDGKIEDDVFSHLSHHLPAGATIVLNDTRVIEARIHFQKPTGGQIEIFCLEPFNQPVELALNQKQSVSWLCLIGGASKWKPGMVLQKQITVGGTQVLLMARYVHKTSESFVIEFSWTPGELSFIQVIHGAGSIPLPPYIKRAPEASDLERYQTVFSHYEGSVAAPTAALHFTPGVLEELKKKNIEEAMITLHVGAGTFKPVKSETIEAHQMHREPFRVTRPLVQKLLNSKQIIAVGTTSLRTLESLHWLGVKLRNGVLGDEWSLQQWEAYELSEKYPALTFSESISGILNWMEGSKTETIHCRTSLLIAPGYEFQVPAALITNFHQPQSTLILLVAAFIGEDWKKVYQHALEEGYRFLSYGDSSLLWKK